METCIFWFRRDLRLADNAALCEALNSGAKVIPVFIFDKKILDALEDKADRRVAFIHQTISNIQQQLKTLGSNLMVEYGNPEDLIKKWIDLWQVKNIYTNHDYEPYAKMRDSEITSFLQSKGGNLFTFKDQVIFEKSEVTKDDGLPYTVYTPYSKKWKAKLSPEYIKAYPTEKHFDNFCKTIPSQSIPSLKDMNFLPCPAEEIPSSQLPEKIIQQYHETRDIPSLHGTSRLGIHLRFGTISIRALATYALAQNEKYLNELIWREFYQQILWHFPHVANASFKKAYDFIEWRNNENEFTAWCNGKTGYPIVDAGMRELNATGWMHNRVRMIVASFLSKHLLIDWRWGEAYFAKKLIDFDLASNNGGWQWAAGSGVDAAPYFRIFSPKLQTERFDKQLIYIKKWIPELSEFSYPQPIVDHDMARKRCLETYGKALKPAP
jgi:deoxyribodipyrimidine photo-lyase